MIKACITTVLILVLLQNLNRFLQRARRFGHVTRTDIRRFPRSRVIGVSAIAGAILILKFFNAEGADITQSLQIFMLLAEFLDHRIMGHKYPQ